MAKTKYIYTGQSMVVTLKCAGEVALHHGNEVELDADNAYVKGLVARKHLKPVKVNKGQEVYVADPALKQKSGDQENPKRRDK